MRAAVDSREMDQGDVREIVGEIPVEESRQPWKRGDTAKSCIGGGAITIASLSPGQQLNNREAGPPNACHTDLQRRTPCRVPL